MLPFSGKSALHLALNTGGKFSKSNSESKTQSSELHANSDVISSSEIAVRTFRIIFPSLLCFNRSSCRTIRTPVSQEGGSEAATMTFLIPRPYFSRLRKNMRSSSFLLLLPSPRGIIRSIIEIPQSSLSFRIISVKKLARLNSELFELLGNAPELFVADFFDHHSQIPKPERCFPMAEFQVIGCVAQLS